VYVTTKIIPIKNLKNDSFRFHNIGHCKVLPHAPASSGALEHLLTTYSTLCPPLQQEALQVKAMMYERLYEEMKSKNTVSA